jgi:hypothetical protein
MNKANCKGQCMNNLHFKLFCPDNGACMVNLHGKLDHCALEPKVKHSLCVCSNSECRCHTQDRYKREQTTTTKTVLSSK